MFKVTERRILRDGRILFILVQVDDKGKVTAEMKVILTKEQLGTMQLLGDTIPKVNSEVAAKYSENPITGEQSHEWGNFV